MGGDEPLSHNHLIDVYYRFPQEGVFDWGEIAFVNLRCIYMFHNPRVLDLGCADGFYYSMFYKYISDIEYIGYDIDNNAINKAKIDNEGDKKCTFLVRSFLTQFPDDDLGITNVLWNSSIQMFMDDDIDCILKNIKKCLSGNKGILSGTATVIEKGKPAWEYCVNPYKKVGDVKHVLLKFFSYVYVYKDRGMGDMCFFVASDNDALKDALLNN